jgi:Holliday junction resolvase-like predicted endonuclease
LERAIDHKKQRRIVGAARIYLRDRLSGSHERSVRFDVVFVPADNESIRHIKGAFDSEWPE